MKICIDVWLTASMWSPDCDCDSKVAAQFDYSPTVGDLDGFARSRGYRDRMEYLRSRISDPDALADILTSTSRGDGSDIEAYIDAHCGELNEFREYISRAESARLLSAFLHDIEDHCRDAIVEA